MSQGLDGLFGGFCGDAIQHSDGAGIFINIRPMNSLAIPNNLKIFVLFGSSIRPLDKVQSGIVRKLLELRGMIG